ncbi:hypothetical protein Voc01_079160 [Virgisporangium ochraceum]|uniref:Uncharacterized protein n=1 Tax=Virgisporangium ochraceum TaxID=65505 RepID=A0A8J4EFM8_9ACTN|nr:hypothetical protein Voc01_079160 [Virgisporangium ochraceum]
MRFPGSDSWQVSVKAEENHTVFPLWLRDVEAVDVPPSPLVPGPLDVNDLPPPAGEPHDPRLGAEWLAWWESIVLTHPTSPVPPDDDVEPAYDTPDPLGLARLPALRPHVARRWPEFLEWQLAHRRAHGTYTDRRPPGDGRIGEVVREVEAELGRRAAPFHLTFTLLQVRDDRILTVEPGRFLVPERVIRSAGWPDWLRAEVRKVA